MDESVHPPVRLQAISSTTLSTRSVKTRVDDFLTDFQNRSTPAKGGDTTVTAQLQKLSEALQQKLDRRKTSGGALWYVTESEYDVQQALNFVIKRSYLFLIKSPSRLVIATTRLLERLFLHPGGYRL